MGRVFPPYEFDEIKIFYSFLFSLFSKLLSEYSRDFYFWYAI